MASELNPTTTTDDGLVLKNAARVEDIATRIDIRVEARLTSWKCNRLIRRDFNLVTSKMFIRCRDRTLRYQVLGLLEELVLQSEFLKAESSQYAISHALPTTIIPIRIVCPEASMLYKTLIAIDDSITRFHCAYLDEIVTLNTLQGAPEEALAAFSDLKHYILGTSAQQTAHEMGRDNGIT